MRVVECVSDDWKFLEESTAEAFKNGAKCPKVGDIILTIGNCSKSNGYIGYKLDGFDWSEFGVDVCWNIDKFKIIDSEEGKRIILSREELRNEENEYAVSEEE